MTMLLPALAGASLLVAFLFGSSAKADEAVKKEADSLDDDQKEDVKEAAKAVEAEDWMTAVAAAVKSDSTMAMQEVAAALKEAGLKEEAADLLALAKSKKAKDKKKPTLAKPKKAEPKAEKKKPPALAKPDKKKAEADAKKKADAAAKRAAEQEAERKAKREAKKKEEAEAKKKAEAKAKKAEAESLRAHLASTGRYKENLALVEAYQRHNGLTPDSKYGIKTAKTFWSTYKLVPVNPFYWPASNTSKELAAYQAFLDSIKADAPQHTAEVDKLKKTVGK